MQKTSSTAINIIAAAVVTFGLIYFDDLLKPLALAIFLWLVIDGGARTISQQVKFIPYKLVLPLMLVVVFVGLALIITFIGQYAKSLAGDFNLYHDKIDASIAQIYHMFPQLGAPPSLDELTAKMSPSVILNGLADTLKTFGEQALFVLLYVVALFATQASLPRKIKYIVPSLEEREKTFALGSHIRKTMEVYLGVQTFTGVIFGVVAFALFTILGLKNALFWGLLTFVMCYVPVVGGVVATALPAILAIIQFGGPVQALVIVGVMQAVHFVVGNFILPKMSGESLNLSILVVFLSLAFWGKIWGTAGLFLAVPLSVMVMIILAQFPSTRAIAVMMSANGNPDVDLGSRKRHKQLDYLPEN